MGENHCSATHLGLALVTNVVSVFWGVFFCFSLTLVIFLKEKRRNWATFERCSSRFAAQRMKMKSPSAKYAQLDTGYHWFGGISSCVRFKNVHFNHDVSHDVFDHWCMRSFKPLAFSQSGFAQSGHFGTDTKWTKLTIPPQPKWWRLTIFFKMATLRKGSNRFKPLFACITK